MLEAGVVKDSNDRELRNTHMEGQRGTEVIEGGIVEDAATGDMAAEAIEVEVMGAVIRENTTIDVPHEEDTLGSIDN